MTWRRSSVWDEFDRLASIIKIIETPKRDDPLRHDRRMLRRLRAYAGGADRMAKTL